MGDKVSKDSMKEAIKRRSACLRRIAAVLDGLTTAEARSVLHEAANLIPLGSPIVLEDISSR